MRLKKIVSNLLLLCFILLVGCSADSFQGDDISLKNLHEGDLMFVVKETSNPITDATQGIDGLKIDHVASVIGLLSSLTINIKSPSCKFCNDIFSF